MQGSNDSRKVHKELGDCPTSQRILMILRLKKNVPPFEEHFVDPSKRDQKRWEEFVGMSQGRLKLPVLLHGDLEPMEDSDRIETYLDKTFEPSLECENEKANNAGRDLYSKFALFMRNGNPQKDEKLRDALNKELTKLNEFLDSVESPGKYLDGDDLKLPDCNLLPKLMHVKIAGELKELELKNFQFVMEYLEKASQQNAFKDTFTDNVKKDIEAGWRKKMGNSTTSSCNSHK